MILKYIPDRGEIVWLEYNPQVGHEQSGRRPSLVISPKDYNNKVGLALFCPITSLSKGYPFEVKIPYNLEVAGVILSDQIKSLDWNTRKAKFICKLPDKCFKEVMGKIKVLL
jgi:mRNA interferase MazF